MILNIFCIIYLMNFLIRITVLLLFFQLLSAQTVIKRDEKIKTVDRLGFI